MFRLGLIFSHYLHGEALRFKRLQTLTPMLAANGFWSGRFERSFFDVRVFNPSAPSNHPFKSAYLCHEREKRHQYEQHVHKVEHGHFTPLVFTITGGMADAADHLYRRLANLLSEKLNLSRPMVR